MKTKKSIFRYLKISMAVAVLILAAANCKKDFDIVTPSDPPVLWNPCNTTISVVFTDARTGDPIGFDSYKDVDVTITGNDADVVVSAFGIKKSDYIPDRGFLTLGIENSYAPSYANPVKFNVVAKANGYLTTSLPVTIFEESHQAFTVKMVNLEAPPTGVSVAIDNSGYCANGVVTTSVELQTQPVSTTNTGASVYLPENTIVKDKYGTPLNGTLKTQLVYFNNIDDESLLSFPGGLVVEANTEGGKETIAFYSAGFMAIEIVDAAGRIAKTFEENNLQVSVDAPPQTYNPETGTSIQTGDEIPLWSFEVEAGVWKYEKVAIVGETNSNGNYMITSDIGHLTYLNFDWKGSACDYGAKFKFTSSTIPSGSSVNFQIHLRKQSDNTIIRTRSVSVHIDEEIQFVNVPSGMPVFVEIVGSTNTCTVEIDDLCNIMLYEVSLDDCGFLPPQPVPVTIDIQGYCPGNDTVLIRPSMHYFYKKCDEIDWMAGYIENGYDTIYDVMLGDCYSFGVYSNGAFRDTTVVIDQNALAFVNIHFDQEVCDLFE